MYQIIDGPEACRLFPDENLRPVFKSKLKKVWKELQTPAAFSAWLDSERPKAVTWAECLPLKVFVRGLVPRQMEVRTNLDRTVIISDWKHCGMIKPTAALNLPGWVWKFVNAYLEAWSDFTKRYQDTEYVFNGEMPYESLRRLLDDASR